MKFKVQISNVKVFALVLSLCALSFALFAFPKTASAEECILDPNDGQTAYEACLQDQQAKQQQKTTAQTTPGFSFDLRSFYQPVAGKPVFQSVGRTVGFFYRIILFFAGIIAFFLLILGGVRYIMSGGDAKKTEEARNMLTVAILGFALVVVAAMIYPLLQKFFGLPKLF